MRNFYFIFLFLSTPIYADDFSGFKLGAELGEVEATVESDFVDFASNDFDDDTLFFKGSLGYQFNEYIAVSLGYFEFLDWSNYGFILEGLDELDEKISIDGRFLSLTGSMPLGNRLFVSAEIGRSKWNATANPGTFNGDDRREGYEYFTEIGVGMRFSNNLVLSLNRFDMRADLFESTAYTMAIKYVF